MYGTNKNKTTTLTTKPDEWMNEWMHEKLVAVNGNNINFSTEINKNESY